MASPNSTLPNDEKEAQDSAYNPGEQAYREGIGAGHVKSGTDQLEAFANDPKNHDDSADVRSAEEQGGGWANNVSSALTGNKSNRKDALSVANFKAIVKKRGPLTAILTLIFGGGLGVGIFMSPSLLLIHVQEMFVDKFDAQNTSMTIRTNKIIANKLAEDTTQGSCQVVKVACRFSRPSNKLLGNLEKNGVKAFDAKGDPIDKKNSLFQNKRPSSYEFNGKTITAKEFSAELRTNSELRAAFHRAYNPRFAAFSDSVFRAIGTRFGFDKKNRFADVKDPAEIQERINETAKGSDVGAKAASESGEEAAEKLLEKLIKERGAKALDTLSKAGKGSAVTLAAGAVCIATDIPSSAIAISRAYQLAQLVSYSAGFLSATSAMKASSSDFTPETATALGTMLTATVGGKSAMDSFGMKNALYGDTSTTDKTYKNYTPGSGAVGALGGINQFTGSDITKEACEVALNPVTGAAINAMLVATGGASFGTTALAAGINFTAGVVLGEVINIVAEPAIDLVMPLVRPALSGILGTLLGDLTANLVGVDAGNALASGASHLMGQTANAGGNIPLTVEQAVAYNSSTQEVQLAYAQEDRATLSPFDATNKNTFLGSIVNNLVPYYGELNTISGVLKTIGSIPFMSFSSLLKSTSANAADPSAEYALCDDPAIKNNNIAAGPFCNIEYGVPTEYLNMDPQQIVEQLVATGDIDESTGEPIDKPDDDSEEGTSSLKNWMTLCGDGTTDQVASCKIDAENDPEGAKLMSLYAVYTIDHRIQKTMDDEDSDIDLTALKESTDKVALAQKIVAKGKVEYILGAKPTLESIADGTNDPDKEPCGININILQMLDAITDEHSIKISSFNRQCTNDVPAGSSTSSRHYAGNGSAIDIAVIDGVATTGRDANALKVIAIIMPYLTEAAAKSGGTNSQLGQQQCGTLGDITAGIVLIPDTCNHLHFDVPPPSDGNLEISEGF